MGGMKYGFHRVNKPRPDVRESDARAQVSEPSSNLAPIVSNTEYKQNTRLGCFSGCLSCARDCFDGDLESYLFWNHLLLAKTTEFLICASGIDQYVLSRRSFSCWLSSLKPFFS